MVLAQWLRWRWAFEPEWFRSTKIESHEVPCSIPAGVDSRPSHRGLGLSVYKVRASRRHMADPLAMTLA